jgi:hypothetical protein
MAGMTGGRLVWSAIAISVLAAVAALLCLQPPQDLLATLSWIVAGVSLAIAFAALLRARGVAAEAAQLSSELDVVSQRLLDLEANASPPPAAAPADPRLDELSASMHGLTAGVSGTSRARSP